MKPVIDLKRFKTNMYMDYVSSHMHREGNGNHFTQEEYYEKYDDFLNDEYKKHYVQKQEVSDV
tara:strand:+ start:361 stop:549 length:189 start_codon:yes stop_codon:yes gene_type:complete